MALGQIKKEIEHATVYYKAVILLARPGLHAVLGFLFTEIL